MMKNTKNSFILTLFPGGSDGKASDRNAGDPGSIPGLGRSPEEGNGNALQYSCLENSMDGRTWWATVHGVTKSQTRLSNFMTSRCCWKYFVQRDLHSTFHLFLSVSPCVSQCPEKRNHTSNSNSVMD